MMGKMARLVNSLNMDTLPHFFFCEVIFLIKGNTVSNTMIVVKAPVSPGMVVLVEVFGAGKKNLYLK